MLFTVRYQSTVQSEAADALRAQLLEIDKNASMTEYDPSPQMAIEWALPAIIGMAFGAVSTSFFNELGKDMYSATKSWVTAAFKTSNGSERYWSQVGVEPTLGGSENRSAEKSLTAKTSPPLKISFEYPFHGASLVFVFDKDLKIDTVGDAFDAMTEAHSILAPMIAWIDRQHTVFHARPDRYNLGMPQDLWITRLGHKRIEALANIAGTFAFDPDAKIWVKVY